MILRQARSEDAKLLWIWRNNPDTRAMFLQSHEITWEEHLKWYENALRDRRMVILIGEIAGRPVGTIRMDKLEGACAELSINIAPEQRGKGYGKAMLSAACSQSKDIYGLNQLMAKIKLENHRSISTFASVGFYLQDVKDDIATYTIML